MLSEKQQPLFKPDFLQIPFQLIDDRGLDAMDRMLYGVIYWYEHLRDGECRASNQSFASLLYTTTRVVQNSLNRLEERGHITRDYKDAAKRNRLRIHGNISYKRLSPIDDRRPANALQITRERPTDDRRERSIDDQSKNRLVKNKRENKLAAPSAAGKDPVNDLIQEFEPLNPSFARLFSNKTQRQAMLRLIDKYGLEKMRGTIRYLPTLADKPYAPSITTPYELESKLGKLVDYMRKEKAKGPMLVTI